MEERLNEIYSKIAEGEAIYDELRELLKHFNDFRRKIHETLKYALRYGNPNERTKIEKLYLEFQRENIEDMFKDIQKEARKLEKLSEDFQKQAYRIMELARHGKRSEVQRAILRIFMANKHKIPPTILNMFDPAWDDETFKTFIYTFLAQVLNSKKEVES